MKTIFTLLVAALLATLPQLAVADPTLAECEQRLSIPDNWVPANATVEVVLVGQFCTLRTVYNGGGEGDPLVVEFHGRGSGVPAFSSWAYNGVKTPFTVLSPLGNERDVHCDGSLNQDNLSGHAYFRRSITCGNDDIFASDLQTGAAAMATALQPFVAGQRVLVWGGSQGGMMSLGVGLLHPELGVSRVVSINGCLGKPEFFTRLLPAELPDTFIVESGSDSIVPPECAMDTALSVGRRIGDRVHVLIEGGNFGHGYSDLMAATAVAAIHEFLGAPATVALQQN